MASAATRVEIAPPLITRSGFFPVSPDWIITLSALALLGAIFSLAIWQSGRKRPDSADVRWIPWRFVVVIVGAFLGLGLIHVVNLLGIHTGRDTY